LAATDQRLGDRAPAQSGDDGLDAASRARAVMTGADVEGIRQALRLFEAGIVGPVEEILERSGHVTEVFGRAEDDRPGGNDVLRPGRERRTDHHLDVLDLIRRGAANHRVAQGAGVVRWDMGDDEQALGGHPAGIVATGSGYPVPFSLRMRASPEPTPRPV